MDLKKQILIIFLFIGLLCASASETLHGNETMVPFVEAIVPVVDLEEKKIIINNLPGLFDEV